jgi:hypothetical protein
LHIIFRRIVLEAAQIWQELFHTIFRLIVLEAAQIWQEPQQKNKTTTQLYYLRFGGNWLHIIFRQIVLEAAQIWRK